MPSPVPESPPEIAPAWPAVVLSGERAGDDVEVTVLRFTTATKWNVADTTFLEVDYRRAECELPRQLFVKIAREPDPFAEQLPGVQAHYADARGAHQPIAPCLAARRVSRPGARTADRRSRIHGDTHVWNVLHPVDPAAGEAVLIGWEDWRVDIAAADRAQLIALRWYPDRSARHQSALLEDHLSSFNARSPRALAWNEFWLDDWLGHLSKAINPVFQHSVTLMPAAGRISSGGI